MKRFLDSIFPSTAAARGPGDDLHLADVGEPAVRACPDCAAPAAADQDWCLECGSRIDSAGARWHQPAAVMASVALIFVAGLALALSEVAKDAEIAGAKTIKKTVAAAPPAPASTVPDVPAAPEPSKGDDVPSTSSNDTDDGGARIPSPGSSSSSDDPTVPDLGSSPGSSFSTGTGTYVPPAAATPAPVKRWADDGKKDWTVILLSTTSKSEAEKLARKATGKGFHAGILSTNDVKCFADDVWLVWAGQYKDPDDADKSVDKLDAEGLPLETTEKIIPEDDSQPCADDGDTPPEDPPGDETESRSTDSSPPDDE